MSLWIPDFFFSLLEIYDWKMKREKNGKDASGPSSKRLYVENVPQIPGGFSRHMYPWNKMSSDEPGGSKHSVDLQNLRSAQLEPSEEILSVADKYNNMRLTYRRRLVFGKLSLNTGLVFFC